METTKLSLLLKVLEGETAATIESQLSFLHERALPDLSANIKCGNSLIGPDFYDDQQLGLAGLDEEERYRINVFDWEAEFPEILGKAVSEEKHGFDAVIGNPPYLKIEHVEQSDRDYYFGSLHAACSRRFDIRDFSWRRHWHFCETGGRQHDHPLNHAEQSDLCPSSQDAS